MTLNIPHLRELMKKATKGEWKLLDTEDTLDTKVRIVVSETEACGVEVTTCCGEREDALADAEFIVEMENSISELLRLAEIGQRVEEPCCKVGCDRYADISLCSQCYEENKIKRTIQVKVSEDSLFRRD